MRFFWVLWLGLTVCVASEPPAAVQLLSQSKAFHDPSGEWSSFAHTLKIRETRPGGSDRQIAVTLDRQGERFVYDRTMDGEHLVKSMVKGSCRAILNGSETISEADAKRLRTGCGAIERTYHYYLYLYGLPMKLEDPGTQIDPEVKVTEFAGREVWAMRVTYTQSVGTDIWYFYFDPATSALTGCRFYHDEAKGDGEFIIFDGLYQLEGMRIPQNRTWYTNQDQRLLGSDHLEGHEPL